MPRAGSSTARRSRGRPTAAGWRSHTARTCWVAGPADFAHARLLLAKWGGVLGFTPDSRFVSTRGQSARPLLIPLAGGRAAKGLDGGLGTWSRDGRLAFLVYPTHFPIKPGFALPVYVTDTHGTHPRLAGRFTYDDHALGELHWLPDGKRVLYLASNTCGANGLYAVSAAGGPTRRLTRDPRNLGTPAWSPDGTRIAYSVQAFGCHIDAGQPIHLESVAANGAGVEKLTDEDDFDSSPSYSPDGRRVVFTHSTFDSSEMQIVEVGDSTRQPLPPEGTPAWSPDGSRIAYLSGSEIMAIAPAGGTPEAIATGLPKPSCGGGGIAWSPDGKQLAVGEGAGIYLVTAGEPGSAHLAIPVHCAEFPTFSPDGTQIAFDAAAAHPLGGQSAIMAAHVDGSGVRVLSTVPFRQSVHPPGSRRLAWPNGTRRVPFGGRGEGAWRPAQAPGRHAIALHPWLTSAGEVSRGGGTRGANQRVVPGDFDALAPAPSAFLRN